MSESQSSELPEGVPEDDLIEAEASQGMKIAGWSVKGMSLARRNAIARAAKARRETIAEYLWAAHEVRVGKESWPAEQALAEGIPQDDESLERELAERGRQQPERMSLVELFDVVCKFAAADPTPKRGLFRRQPSNANAALLDEARAMLHDRLREMRGQPDRPRLPAPEDK